MYKKQQRLKTSNPQFLFTATILLVVRKFVATRMFNLQTTFEAHDFTSVFELVEITPRHSQLHHREPLQIHILMFIEIGYLIFTLFCWIECTPFPRLIAKIQICRQMERKLTIATFSLRSIVTKKRYTDFQSLLTCTLAISGSFAPCVIILAKL